MLALGIHFFWNGEFYFRVSTCKILFNNHFNCCTNASVRDRITLWFQFIVTSLLHCILSLEVDDIGALLSLFMAMSADLHECIDHPFKRINLVIPHNEGTGFFHTGKNIGVFPFLYIGLSSHETKIRINFCQTGYVLLLFIYMIMGIVRVAVSIKSQPAI